VTIVNSSGNFQPPSVNTKVDSGINLPQPSSRAPSTGNKLDNNFGSGLKQTTQASPEKVNVRLINLQEAKEVKDSKMTKGDLKNQVEEIQQFNQSIDRTLHFKVDDELGVTIVRVLDKETEELIRQFPPEELLNLSRRLKDLNESGSGGASQTGILLQEKV
jgi:flagellar protein FlaG